jgi:hypothetical protein
MAQLTNIGADHLAEAARALPKLQLWVLPNERIALKIGGCRTTRRLKSAVWEAAGLQELKEMVIK